MNISQDLSESRRKVVLECVGEPYNFNVFSVPAKYLVRDFISSIFLGMDGNFLVDIPFGPSMVDYVARLTDAHEVIKFIGGKPTIL